MNNKTNPWMIATFTLAGLIIGYFLGKANLPFATKNVIPTVTQQNVGAVTIPDPQTGGDGSPSALQPLNTVLATNYDNIEKTLTKDGHLLIGSKKAKVKIEEFSDFQCPFCYRFFTETMPRIIKDYVATGKASYVYYNFPLDFHLKAPKAAEAALCAGDQNKYWEMHDLLFQNQSNWSENNNYLQTFETLAQSLKLNTDNFKNCLAEDKFAKLIQDDLNLGKKKDVSGTPTVFINGKKIVGAQPYEAFKDEIENALK